MTKTRTLTRLGILLGSAAICTSVYAAKPLLMDGKQTLYQRVLVKPDALIHQKAAANSKTSEITPFSVLYVYQRKQVGDQQWLQVGNDIHGSLTGWIKAERTIAWNQGLTVAFKDNPDTDRVMLFKDKQSLQNTIAESDLSQYKKLYKNAAGGKRDVDSPVVAIAPPDISALKDTFYLVPILDHEDTYLGQEKATLLNIASVSVKQKKTDEPEPVKSKTVVKTTQTLKAGIVFVIDSTLSMGPYIERTRQAVRRIQRELSTGTDADHLKFGLIAFRDNLQAAPDLGYVTQTFAPLAKTDEFLSKVDAVKAAQASSQDFREDAFSGVKSAVDELDWGDTQARYIVLITDAGARGAQDPLSGTKLSAEALQQSAIAKNIATTVLHLKTTIGAENHAEAQRQYEALSNFPGIGSLYYGVDAGDVGQFGTALDNITGQIKQQVQVTKTDTVEAPAEETSVEEKPEDSALAKLQEKIAKIGYALQMQYLRSDDTEDVPEIIDAWIVDRDIKDPSKDTMEVRVLLTRDQLSELHDVMRDVLNSFEEGIISPRNFLEDLKSVAANLSRDPEQLKNSTGSSNLASMGLMQEYIDDLPYQSPTMNISADEWELWSPEQQIAFAHKLEEKIAYYRALYEHSNLWTTPGGGEINGSSVFALPLDMMP